MAVSTQTFGEPKVLQRLSEGGGEEAPAQKTGLFQSDAREKIL